MYMLKVRLEVGMQCAPYSVSNGSSITQTAACVCACVCMWERASEWAKKRERESALRNSLAYYFLAGYSMTAQWHIEEIITLAVNMRQRNGNMTDNMRRKMRESVCLSAAHLLRTVCLRFKVYKKLADSPPAQTHIAALNTCQVKLFDENLLHQAPSDLAALRNRSVAFICNDTKQEEVWYKNPW